MEGPEKIDKWLHVWSEAERERRIKKPAPDRLGTVQGESPASRTEENVQGVASCAPNCSVSAMSCELSAEVMRPVCILCAELSARKKDQV